MDGSINRIAYLVSIAYCVLHSYCPINGRPSLSPTMAECSAMSQDDDDDDDDETTRRWDVGIIETREQEYQ